MWQKIDFVQDDLGDQATLLFNSYGDGIYIVKLTTKTIKILGKKIIIKKINFNSILKRRTKTHKDN
jgi:hypothetical protein